MSTALVPDASLAAKWILNEADSVKATAILRAAGNICAPGLLRIEVRAAVSRAFRTGALLEADAQHRLTACDTVLSSSRVRYLPDVDLLSRAAEISLSLKHNFQDCMYIACAERVAGVLITADARLVARASPHFSFVRPL